MTLVELQRRISEADPPAILDVRSAAEFASGHVPGAWHLPFQSVWRRGLTLPISPDDPLVVYCGHGPRAWIAGAQLRRLGFRAVTYLEGHWAGWRRAGLPVEQTSAIGFDSGRRR